MNEITAENLSEIKAKMDSQRFDSPTHILVMKDILARIKERCDGTYDPGCVIYSVFLGIPVESFDCSIAMGDRCMELAILGYRPQVFVS